MERKKIRNVVTQELRSHLKFFEEKLRLLQQGLQPGQLKTTLRHVLIQGTRGLRDESSDTDEMRIDLVEDCRGASGVLFPSSLAPDTHQHI